MNYHHRVVPVCDSVWNILIMHGQHTVFALRIWHCYFLWAQHTTQFVLFSVFAKADGLPEDCSENGCGPVSSAIFLTSVRSRCVELWGRGDESTVPFKWQRSCWPFCHFYQHNLCFDFNPSQWLASEHFHSSSQKLPSAGGSWIFVSMCMFGLSFYTTAVFHHLSWPLHHPISVLVSCFWSCLAVLYILV
jgi:hypothetical protein